jgi:hypothetical protein
MNERLANFLNPTLALFGRKIIRVYIGHWTWSAADQRATRSVFPMGWRLAPRDEWEGLPDGATELERFHAAQKRRVQRRHPDRGLA